jgi:hypothetical protein
MQEIFTFPKWKERRFLTAEGEFNDKFKCVYYLMIATGISELNSLRDIFEMVCRMRAAVCTMERVYNKQLVHGNELIRMLVNENSVHVTLEDLIEHQGLEIQFLPPVNTAEYKKQPFHTWGLAHCVATFEDWDPIMEDLIRVEGIPLYHFLKLNVPENEIAEAEFEKCVRWTMEKMAFY